MKHLLTVFWTTVLGSLLTFSLQARVDVILSSYDRPLQLELCLRSCQTFLKGDYCITVIYRISNQEFEDGYVQLCSRYPSVIFKQQSIENPHQDYKSFLLEALHSSDRPYVLFGVDDIVVKEHVDLDDMITKLEKYGAYGFYLRLGTHLTYCYSENRAMPLPQIRQLEENLYAWQFGSGICDWNYPHTVDMTLYRKKHVLPYMEQLNYYAPNILESLWASYKHVVSQAYGLCYRTTKIINIPANRVQTVFKNRAMDSFSPQQLLQYFKAGYRIALEPFIGVMNSAAHMEYMYTFEQNTTTVDGEIVDVGGCA